MALTARPDGTAPTTRAAAARAGRPSRAMARARPIVGCNPLTGERAIMLTLSTDDDDDDGVTYTATLEWSTHDRPGMLSVGLSPQAEDRAALRVLVMLNRHLWALRDRATARDDGPGAELWNDAARRLLVYRVVLGDMVYAAEERRAQPRPLPVEAPGCDDEAVAYG